MRQSLVAPVIDLLACSSIAWTCSSNMVFLFQKAAVFKCNMAGKPVVIARVVDSMTENLRPTRAEATDVANAVLDGTDAILLGAETFRGLYPVKAISTVGKICAEAERLYNQAAYFKKAVKYAEEPMSHLESIASSAVHAAIKVKASVIIVFTSSGQAARLIAKYRPTMPVLAVVIPRVKVNDLRWNFAGAFQTATAKANLPAFSNFVLASIKSLCRRLKAAILMLYGFPPASVLNNYPARQFLVARGIFPVLAVPRHPAESSCGTNESMLKMALDHVKGSGMVKPHDRVVVCQKINNSSVLKTLEIEE